MVARLGPLCALAALGLFACSRPPGASCRSPADCDTTAPTTAPTTGSGPTDDPVADQLVALGVDVTPTPRLDDAGAALPDGYSPLGPSRSFDTLDELAILGLAVPTRDDGPLALLELDRRGTQPSYTTDVLLTPEPSPGPDGAWAHATAVAGDFDEDGRQELALVTQDAPGGPLTVQIRDDATADFRTFPARTLPALQAGDITALAATAGDFDGDGATDLAVALASTEEVVLHWVDDLLTDGAPTVVTESLRPTRADSRVGLALDAGHLDHDPGEELVLVVNERFGELGASSRHVVFDDADHGFVVLREGPVQGDLSVVNRAAVAADVALGDIDGDNLDEIVLAGLTNLDPDEDCDPTYLLVAIDDEAHGAGFLGTDDPGTTIHGGCDPDAPGKVEVVFTDVLDLDGDGVGELHVNGHVFEDLVQAPAFTPVIAPRSPLAGDDGPVVVPDEALFGGDATRGFSGRFDARTVAMAVGDVTSDGRQDLMVYSRDAGSLQVWGLSDPGDGVVGGQWRALHRIAHEPSDDLGVPALVPLNFDDDSLAIAFDEGSYQLVFTEPVILAALAAAPCNEDFGQDLLLCRTSYGEGASQSQERTNTVSVTASVSVGFERQIFGTGVDIEARLRTTASRSWSRSYTLSKRFSYFNGPSEDTVVLTTIPMDQYTYTLTAHPDPDLVGERVVVSLPREPIVLQVERGYYEDNVIEGGPRLDDVFVHTLGDPWSYPTAAEKDALLGPLFGFMQVGPRAVGRSEGALSQSLQVETAEGDTTAFGASFEASVETTLGGFAFGFSLGAGTEHALSVRHGETLTYSGRVADMSADAFAENAFSWGLFAHVHHDETSGQAFEVVQYWVE